MPTLYCIIVLNYRERGGMGGGMGGWGEGGGGGVSKYNLYCSFT